MSQDISLSHLFKHLGEERNSKNKVSCKSIATATSGFVVNRRVIVQALNSPFARGAPYIGVEPRRAKRKSRITCMRMLITNQSETMGKYAR